MSQVTAPPLIKSVEEYIQTKLGQDSLYQRLEPTKRMLKALKGYTTNTGKVIRPTYVYAGALATGYIKPAVTERPGEISPIDFRKETTQLKHLLPAALAIQIDHDWMLMRDDMEDESLLRRGEDAYHVKHGRDFANNDADVLRLLAEKTINGSREMWGTEIYYRMIDAREDMLTKTMYGQNLEFEKRSAPLNETSLDDIIGEGGILQNKSGYTNWTPLRYSLILSGKSDSEIEKLEKPMKKVTVGFQVIDDVLNMRMKEEDAKGEVNLQTQRYGKDFLGDIEEGKRTVPLILLYNVATPAEKKFLEDSIKRGPYDKRFKNSSVEIETRKQIVKKMDEYGVLDIAEKLAKSHLEEGNREIANMVNWPHPEQLMSINNFAVYRKF